MTETKQLQKVSPLCDLYPSQKYDNCIISANFNQLHTYISFCNGLINVGDKPSKVVLDYTVESCSAHRSNRGVRLYLEIFGDIYE